MEHQGMMKQKWWGQGIRSGAWEERNLNVVIRVSAGIELSFIKTHSQAGYDILKDIEFPWPIAEIILQHHERLDG
jgi:hypothetical protein